MQRGYWHFRSRFNGDVKEHSKIAYGFDMQQYPEVKINYNSDGTVSEEEGERLLRIVLEQSKNQINSYLDDTNQVLDQNAYDAVMELFFLQGRTVCQRNHGKHQLKKEMMKRCGVSEKISIIDMHIRIVIKIMHKKQKHM